MSRRAWFPPDNGDEWTVGTAVVEVGSADAPYWWVLCPSTSTLVIDADGNFPIGDCSYGSSCMWPIAHEWAAAKIRETAGGEAR